MEIAVVFGNPRFKKSKKSLEKVKKPSKLKKLSPSKGKSMAKRRKHAKKKNPAYLIKDKKTGEIKSRVYVPGKRDFAALDQQLKRRMQLLKVAKNAKKPEMVALARKKIKEAISVLRTAKQGVDRAKVQIKLAKAEGHRIGFEPVTQVEREVAKQAVARSEKAKELVKDALTKAGAVIAQEKTVAKKISKKKKKSAKKAKKVVKRVKKLSKKARKSKASKKSSRKLSKKRVRRAKRKSARRSKAKRSRKVHARIKTSGKMKAATLVQKIRKVKKGRTLALKAGKKRAVMLKKLNPFGGMSMSKITDKLKLGATTGHSKDELLMVAGAGAAIAVIQKIEEKIGVEALVSKVPVAGPQLAKLVNAGLVPYIVAAIGVAATKGKAQEGAKAMGAVALGSYIAKLSAMGLDMVPGLKSASAPLSGVSYRPNAPGFSGTKYIPNFAGVDVRPDGRAEFDLMGMGERPSSNADFGYRPDQFSPGSDFGKTVGSVPRGLMGVPSGLSGSSTSNMEGASEGADDESSME